ncbi:MAG TPA: GNAT family N-acetyltransferase [Gemmatimonadales bacterium]|nr:GNAT family N-acetyltransferase [Gemmatimonadales bacterium]
MPRDGLSGPDRAAPAEIDRINRVFAEAFTDRYQRDGLAGVRVPLLNPAIWRFAIEAAGDGALVWRDGSGAIAAFNMVHRSGSEGWMGPLAVRPDRQGKGLGRTIVLEGVHRLEAGGARVIGLETMPRTVDNIGFYSRLGFRPRHLTVSVTRTLDGGGSASKHRFPAGPRDEILARCLGLTRVLAPGVDFSREIELTMRQDLGGVTIVSDHGAVSAFALWHTAPLAEGRPGDEARVLKLAARDLEAFRRLIPAIERDAQTAGARQASLRCQTAYTAAYEALLDAGYLVHWTDLRMTLSGKPEVPARDGGVLFSNWEI